MSIRRHLLERDERDAMDEIFAWPYASTMWRRLRRDERDGMSSGEVAVPGWVDMRRKTVAWLSHATTKLFLSRDTLFLAVSTLDRYAALRPTSCGSDRLQLVACASLWLAIKVNERSVPFMDDMCVAAKRRFTTADLFDQELDVVAALDWRISVPFAAQFNRRWSKFTCASSRQHTMSKYLCEASLLDQTLSTTTPPSLVAAAANVLARVLLDRAEPLPQILIVGSGWRPTEILRTVERLHRSVMSSSRDPKDGTTEYYGTDLMMRVSDVRPPEHVPFRRGDVRADRLVLRARHDPTSLADAMYRCATCGLQHVGAERDP